MAAGERSYGAGSYVLTIDESPAIVKTVSGGSPTADVVEIAMGPEKLSKKTISNLKYDNIKLSVGMSMGQAMIDWLNSFLDNKHIRKQGFITYGDFDKKARGYMDFRDGLLTSFTVPACDAGGKDSGNFDIEIAIEESINRKGDAADLKGIVNVKQKAFLTSNFRLTIGDLPCGRVNKIEALAFTCKVQEDAVGQVRIQTKEPTAMSTPNLVVTYSAADEAPWDQWFDDFCIKGNNGDDKELSGSIEWLDPSTKGTIATLEIQHIGIFKLESDAATAGADSIRRKKASMYFEGARFKLGGK
jgi:hypothetical protein